MQKKTVVAGRGGVVLLVEVVINCENVEVFQRGVGCAGGCENESGRGTEDLFGRIKNFVVSGV